MKFKKYSTILTFIASICIFVISGIAFAAKPNLVFITTGGTISSAKDASGAAVPSIEGPALFGHHAESISDLVTYEIVDYKKMDSSKIAPNDWLNIARLVKKQLQRSDVDGVILVHGTDTMEETAFFLQLVIDNPKPCLLTGAMRSSDHLSPDGPENLLSSVRVAIAGNTPKNLVAIVFNDYVISGLSAIKNSTGNVDAFFPGNYGYLASLSEHRINWLNFPSKNKKFNLPKKLPRVDMIYMYPGIDQSFLNTVKEQRAEGLIVIAYGSGNVNTEIAEGLEKILAEGKITVIIETRPEDGIATPSYGGVGGGATLQAQGALLGDYLSPAKSRIALMLTLANGYTKEQIQDILYEKFTQ